jgi:hypothetical protein
VTIVVTLPDGQQVYATVRADGAGEVDVIDTGWRPSTDPRAIWSPLGMCGASYQVEVDA